MAHALGFLFLAGAVVRVGWAVGSFGVMVLNQIWGRISSVTPVSWFTFH